MPNATISKPLPSPAGIFSCVLILLGGLAALSGEIQTAPNVNKAQGAETEGRSPVSRAWAWLGDADQLSGSWGGWRTRLEEKGVKFSFYFNEFFVWKDDGGANRAAVGEDSGSFDWFTTVDFEKMGLWRGGEALAHVKSNWGRNINPDVGALGDPFDDADGDHPIYIDQLWYGHSTANRRLQIRIGYLDQQIMLDRNAYANSEDRQFMSTFLDNNNAIIPLKIGPAAAVLYNPTDWIGFVISVADADARLFHSNLRTTFDDELNFMGFCETDFHIQIPSPHGALSGNYRFGLFLDPHDKPIFGSAAYDGSDEGFYLSFDQQVFAEREASPQGLGLFARYGWRPGDVNRIEHFWSLGAQYQGAIPTRDADLLGFGMYSAIGSDPYREFVSPDFERETAYELYYSLQLTPAIALTPGGQYIEQPGGLTTRDDVWIFALRLRLTF